MSYAGFQRYEVPDIGGNVAKIMLAQQEQDTKRMSAAELAAYRQKKLDAQAAKDANKAAKDMEKMIDTDNTELRKTNLSIPATGHTSFDSMILGLADQTKNQQYENAKILREKGSMYLPEYNQKKQWANGVSGQVKNTVTNLDASLKKIEESKNPNVFVKHLLGQTIKDVTPSAANKMALVADANDQTISFVTYDASGNPVKKPLESLNSVAALSDFDAPDYNADMKKLVDGVGIVAKEQKWAGGSRTVIDPKSQENFDRTRKVYVNSVLNRPVVAADAYVKFVSTPAEPALFIKENATEEEKEMIAKQNGYDNSAEADFVVYGFDKNGLPEIKLTEKQEKVLRENLAQAFTDKSPYKESFALPSSTTVNVTMANPARETAPTLTELSIPINTPQGYEAAVTGLRMAQASKKISDNWEIVKDKNGIPTGDIKVYMSTGTSKYGGYTQYNYSETPTIINYSKDPNLYRIVFGTASDASAVQGDQEGTYPKKNLKK